ncbi:MAG: SpoIIE family protein phosphatase [Bacteroidota bacterium]
MKDQVNKKKRRIGGRIYPVRTFAYVLFTISALATSFHFYDRLTVQAIIFTGVALTYPHLAFLFYRKTGERRQVEFQILLADMVLIGWIAAQFHFSPIVAAIPFVVNSSANFATAGLRVFLQGLVAFALSCLVFGALNGFVFDNTYATTALAMSGLYLFLGTHYLGFLANVQGVNVRKSRAQIMEQKQVIEQSNRSLTSSINYARRIQEAILPFEDRIQGCFGKENFFVFYRPLHIVSGDFYWLEQLEDGKIIVVVADCTGHGVPGAFMSLIGSKILDDVVLQRGITQPNQILEQLDQEIRRILHQNHNENRDGMEAVVMSISPENVAFSGAMNALYYSHKGEFHEVRGSRRWLGGYSFLTKKQFELHENLPPEATFYLCSDGFQDQFGSEQRRKFTRRRLRETLKELSNLSLPEQGKQLEHIHETWKNAGQERQTDDVTIMGFRLKQRKTTP